MPRDRSFDNVEEQPNSLAAPAPPQHHLPSPRSSRQHRFLLLDAIRGVAAVIVSVRHFPTSSDTFPESYLAVDLFFCLSGFVIAASYEERLLTRMSVPTFMLARIVRLYPLYLFGLVLASASAFAHQYHHGASPAPLSLPLSIVLGLLFLPVLSSRGASVFPLNPPSWSLFFEIVANLVYAAMLRLRVAASVVLAGLCVVSFAALLHFLTLRHRTFDAGYTHDSFLLGFARVAFTFFIGVLLFRLYRSGLRLRLQGALAAMVSITLVLFVILCLAVAPPVALRPVYDAWVVALALPAIVLLGACCGVHRRWSPLCSLLGDFSYPLYVLHLAVMAPLYFLVLHSHVSAPPDVVAVVMILLLTPMAWAVSKYYDLPVRRYLAARL